MESLKLGQIDLVHNKSHDFGEADKYWVGYVQDKYTEEILPVAFTSNELTIARRRAESNCEDFLPLNMISKIVPIVLTLAAFVGGFSLACFLLL